MDATFSESLSLYKKHYPLILLISFLVYGVGEFVVSTAAPALGIVTENGAKLTSLAWEFFSYALKAGMIISALVLEEQGKPVSIFSGLKLTFSKGGVVLLTSFAYFLMVGLGAIILLVPGIIFAVRCSMALPLTLREDVSGFEACKESYRLAQGKVLALIGLAIALGLIAWAVSFAFSGALALMLPNTVPGKLDVIALTAGVVAVSISSFWEVYTYRLLVAQKKNAPQKFVGNVAIENSQPVGSN